CARNGVYDGRDFDYW
nr:immunoglobulin heavy chain junction region [Mus musculus]MBK4195622.1 immunoglobulin heavy chain junction region [Mus musculus]MBK4195623.1 immunoglobulin heavy chain junction region [Mus musculus]MBK4195624.1 immunoglobulin heavy chain junction region [Mus musculus]MBK4195625.1 immunoglobulin heavy chain junction region [Mus musculus]